MSRLQNIGIAFLLSVVTTSIMAQGINVEEAWIREAPPVSRVQAGYAIFKNNLNRDIKIIGASSPAFKKIEFHETVLENGLTKMIHQPTVTISHQTPLVFQPEGLHLMLFNPLKPLHAGERVTINFIFSNSTSATASFIIRKNTNSDSSQHKHH